MAVDYKILSDEDLASRFETLCLEQHRSLDREEIADFNMRFDVIQAIEDELQGRVPDGGVASRSHPDAGFGRAGQAATAGRLTMGSSLIGAMLSSVM